MGEYGANYVLSWVETDAFSDTATPVSATGSLVAISPATDTRYGLTQTIGKSSATDSSVLSLFTIDNLSSFNGYIFGSTSTTLTDTLALTLTNMSTVNVGLILPFSTRDLFAEKKVSVTYLYDRTASASIDFRTMTTKINTIVKSVDYIDLYVPYFEASFIDAFGTSSYQNEIHSTLFSNVKTKKYSYGIGNYDVSTIPGGAAVIENSNGGKIDDLILVGNSSSTNYFQNVVLAQSNNLITNGVNVTINKDGTEVVANTVNVPVSIFAKSNMSNETTNSTGIYRNGLLQQISNITPNGININLFGKGYMAYDSQNVSYIPVELVSIFAKRVSQNNTDTLARSDFKITTVTSIPGVTSSVTSLVYALVEWDDNVNSGHDFPWIYDPYLSNSTLETAEVVKNSKNAYLVRNTGSQIVPYNYTFIRSAYLIYDAVYNRTHVLSVPGNTSLYSVQITANSIFATGSVIITSFDNTIINPFDKNFDSTMCLTNSSNNVVSIRVDNQNTVIAKKLGSPTYSNLILGYTETNFVESSC